MFEPPADERRKHHTFSLWHFPDGELIEQRENHKWSLLNFLVSVAASVLQCHISATARDELSFLSY